TRQRSGDQDPHRPPSTSQAGGEREGLRSHSFADVELDRRVVAQRDVTGIAGERLTVEVGRDRAAGRRDATWSERLAPDVEVLAERVGPPRRRLDVDDAVGG